MKGTTMQAKSPLPEVKTQDIIVAGQRLRVAIRPGNGTCTPLLLMNGIGVNLEVLQSFVDALDPALEIIRFDAPGTGGSPAPLIPYRFTSLARLVTKMLDQSGYKQVDVLGVSWGGGLAQQFAVQYPRRCRRLILVSTGTGAFMVPGRLSILAKMAMPRRAMDHSSFERFVEDLYGGSLPTQPEIVHELARADQSGGFRSYLYQALGVWGWTSLPWLRLLRQPTLILHGNNDQLIPPVNAKILHRLIPYSQLYIFHGGHLGLSTSINEVAPAIERFLADAEL
jgi:poly(3-hydroxyalkanoate) depolymerase